MESIQSACWECPHPRCPELNRPEREICGLCGELKPWTCPKCNYAWNRRGRPFCGGIQCRLFLAEEASTEVLRPAEPATIASPTPTQERDNLRGEAPIAESARDHSQQVYPIVAQSPVAAVPAPVQQTPASVPVLCPPVLTTKFAKKTYIKELTLTTLQAKSDKWIWDLLQQFQRPELLKISKDLLPSMIRSFCICSDDDCYRFRILCELRGDKYYSNSSGIKNGRVEPRVANKDDATNALVPNKFFVFVLSKFFPKMPQIPTAKCVFLALVHYEPEVLVNIFGAESTPRHQLAPSNVTRLVELQAVRKLGFRVNDDQVAGAKETDRFFFAPSALQYMISQINNGASSLEDCKPSGTLSVDLVPETRKLCSNPTCNDVSLVKPSECLYHYNISQKKGKIERKEKAKKEKEVLQAKSKTQVEHELSVQNAFFVDDNVDLMMDDERVQPLIDNYMGINRRGTTSYMEKEKNSKLPIHNFGTHLFLDIGTLAGALEENQLDVHTLCELELARRQGNSNSKTMKKYRSEYPAKRNQEYWNEIKTLGHGDNGTDIARASRMCSLSRDLKARYKALLQEQHVKMANHEGATSLYGDHSDDGKELDEYYMTFAAAEAHYQPDYQRNQVSTFPGHPDKIGSHVVFVTLQGESWAFFALKGDRDEMYFDKVAYDWVKYEESKKSMSPEQLKIYNDYEKNFFDKAASNKPENTRVVVVHMYKGRNVMFDAREYVHGSIVPIQAVERHILILHSLVLVKRGFKNLNDLDPIESMTIDKMKAELCMDLDCQLTNDKGKTLNEATQRKQLQDQLEKQRANSRAAIETKLEFNLWKAGPSTPQTSQQQQPPPRCDEGAVAAHTLASTKRKKLCEQKGSDIASSSPPSRKGRVRSTSNKKQKG